MSYKDLCYCIMYNKCSLFHRISEAHITYSACSHVNEPDKDVADLPS